MSTDLASIREPPKLRVFIYLGGWVGFPNRETTLRDEKKTRMARSLLDEQIFACTYMRISVLGKRKRKRVEKHEMRGLNRTRSEFKGVSLTRL